MSKENYIQNQLLDNKIYNFNNENINDFQIIYEGINSKITKAKWNYMNIIIKSYKNNNNEKEIKILNEIKDHPNIINFYGLIYQDLQYNIVLEYANNSNLNDYLQTHFKDLDWKDKINIAKDISRGLLYIHNKNIIHNDLHPKNILVNNKTIKISDFEYARFENEIHNTKTNNGMIAYIEPKTIEDWNYICDKRSDIYALGVIFWQISSGRKPFKNYLKEAIAITILLGNREINIEETPKKYNELYERCWSYNPNNRPEIKEIFNILKEFNI